MNTLHEHTKCYGNTLAEFNLPVFSCIHQSAINFSANIMPCSISLLWPFQNDITIQLLNQLKGTHHHAYCVHFSWSTNPDVVNRMTSNERADTGQGTLKFIIIYRSDVELHAHSNFSTPHLQLTLGVSGTHADSEYIKRKV